MLVPSKAAGIKKPKGATASNGASGTLTSIYERSDLLCKLLDKPRAEFGTDDRIEAINH